MRDPVNSPTVTSFFPASARKWRERFQTRYSNTMTGIKRWRLFTQWLPYLEQPLSISPAGEFGHERVLHSPLIFLFNKILAFLNIKRLLNDAFGNVETFFFFGRFVTLFLHMIPWYCFTKVIPSITLRSSKDMGPCKKIGTQFISMMVTATTLTTPHTHTHTHTHTNLIGRVRTKIRAARAPRT